MTSLLTTHLEQISLCAASIAELPFPGPGIFTNALLSVPANEITSLIRDTEQHERALFHLAPPPLPPNAKAPALATSTAGELTAKTRRTTQHYSRSAPKNKAVAAVLGGDLYQRTRREDHGSNRGELDVEVLLLGAEKLAAVYPMPDAQDKILTLRRRHQQLQANIAHYESRVEEQTRELKAMSRPLQRNDEADDAIIPVTKEDLAREEEEVRELERKKHALESRVEGMERDLGGLMR